MHLRPLGHLSMPNRGVDSTDEGAYARLTLKPSTPPRGERGGGRTVERRRDVRGSLVLRARFEELAERLARERHERGRVARARRVARGDADLGLRVVRSREERHPAHELVVA